MDKLRDFFRTFKRFHFWVICGLVVVVGLAAWYFSTSSLQAESQTGKQAIEQSYQTLMTVQSVDVHPNEEVRQHMEELIDVRVEEIRAAWQKMFDQQKDIFVWPAVENGSIRAMLQDKLPIERNFNFPPNPEVDDPLTLTQKEAYRNYVFDELRQLAESINSKWTATAADASNAGAASLGGSSTGDLIVRWDEHSQRRIVEKHFNWKGSGAGGGSPGEPNTLEVMYAQEDLWVLRALMEIIKRTNGDATTAHNAQIRQIVSIKIGQDAVENPATILVREGAELPEQGDASMSSMPSSTASQEQPVGPDGMPFTGNDPAEGRYVDKDYKPLPAQKLREVMKATSLAPEDAYLAVAKRIPIRMMLKVDQRAVNRLLVECANSRPTVDVRQVRLPASVESESGSRSNHIGHRDTAGQPDGLASAATAFPFDVLLEVYGIVYIYNSVPSEEDAKSVFGVTDEAGADSGSEIPAEDDW